MTALMQGIDWGTQLPDENVTYRFMPGGTSYASPEGNVFAESWAAYEKQQFREAFAIFETFTNLNFTEVVTASADLRLISYDDGPNGTLGAFSPPGEANAGVGVFNYEGEGWDWDRPGRGLEQGGYGFVTLIHELGHGLGLAHPHDNGGTSTIFPGVSSAFGDFGSFNLNQGIYTMMSYNDGWQTAPHGVSPSNDYGWQGTPMAIDIAVLQAKYGANMTHAAGTNVYTLPTQNRSGTFYSCIWDAGGIDAMRAGNQSATIDLRDATLQVGIGGGGFVSHTAGIHGGFTIANGVTIENAIGGRSADMLIGNEADNRLTGGVGRDQLTGGSGEDTFVYRNGASRIANAAADTILDWSASSDALDMTFAGIAANYREQSTSASTIESAAAFAENTYTHPSIAHVFLYNAALDRGFLLSDLNNDNRFETGIVLAGAGAASAMGAGLIV